MATRNAEASWEGGLKDGTGRMRVGSGAFDGRYSFGSRFDEEPGTNPEELLGAALAGCFSMALAAALGRAGLASVKVSTQAKVHLRRDDAGPRIALIELDTEAEVLGAEAAQFAEIAEATRKGCIVSRALAGTEIELTARLL